MPELGPYGSVRGARGNSRLYRDPGSLSDMGKCTGDVCPCTNSRRWMRRVYEHTPFTLETADRFLHRGGTGRTKLSSQQNPLAVRQT